MTVTVLFFGMLKELFRAERHVVNLETDADVASLMTTLGKSLNSESPGETAIFRTVAVAVNREYAGLRTVLHDGDEVALLPPVSGGCSAG